MTATEPLFIFFVTGEPSGDALGGKLIAALRQRTGGDLRIAGIGGERMQDEGLDSAADSLRRSDGLGVACRAGATHGTLVRPSDDLIAV